MTKVFSKVLKDGNGAATSLVQASANNPKTLKSVLDVVRKNKSPILNFIDKLIGNLDKLPNKSTKSNA